jgi:hypothetical protein
MKPRNGKQKTTAKNHPKATKRNTPHAKNADNSPLPFLQNSVSSIDLLEHVYFTPRRTTLTILLQVAILFGDDVFGVLRTNLNIENNKTTPSANRIMAHNDQTQEASKVILHKDTHY